VSRWLSLVTGVFVLNLQAGADFSISGRVVDEDHTGVAAARITFQSASGETQSTVSDPTGAFTLDLPPGQYRARVEHDGYFPLKDFPVDISEDTGEVHLTLNHEREVFQSMDVSASSGGVDVDKTAAEKQLTAAQIIDIPYTPTRDLRAALPLIPGVLQDSAGQLHFDGGAENQTLYLLDGFNFSNPLTGKLDAIVSVEAVRTLDWISGRYSPEFGKGSGGALDVRTDMGDDPWRYSATNFVPGFNTQGGFRLGTYAPRFNLTGPIRKNRAWFSEHADFDYSQPFVPGLPNGQNHTQYFQASNLARAQVNLTPSNILFADFLMNYRFAPETGLDVLDPLSTTTDQRSRTWFFSAKDQIYLTRGMLVEFGIAEDRNFLRVIPQGDAFYDISPFGKSGNYYADSTQKASRAQFLANLFLPAVERAGHHQWKAGVDLDRLNYWQQFARTGINIYDQTGALVRQTIFEGSGTASRPSAEASWYVMDDWKARENVMVEYGVRQDWDELLHRAAFSPRVSAAWSPFAWRNTKFSAGYAILRDATPLALFVRPEDQYSINYFFNPPMPAVVNRFEIPDSRLNFPEFQSWTAGIEQRLPGKIEVKLDGVHKRGRDGLVYVPGAAPGVFDLTNAQRTSYDAGEVTLSQHFGAGYQWMASYTRSRGWSNEVLDLNVDQPLMVTDNAGRVSWDTPNRLVAWAYLPTKWRNWAVALSTEARSGFPYSVVNGDGVIVGAVNSGRYPMFFTFNLHPEWKFTAFGRRWALRGGLNNLTNHINPTVVQTIPGMPPVFLGSEGRHFVVRIRWLGKAN
jgi:hypothetical protein